MDKDLISLLKSSNPQDRIDGIYRLVDENYPDARRILGALYKKETNEDVRAAAKEAAAQLKQAAAGSKRDPQRAQKLLESAMGALIDLRNDEAWTLAAEAFRADPSLAEDDYATGLASEITGLDRSEAVAALLASTPEASGNRKAKNDDKAKVEDVDRVGWGSALGGIGVYAVLIGIVITIPFFLFSSVIGIFAAAIDPSTDVNQVASGLGMLGLIIGVIVIISTFLYTLLYYGIVHFAALNVLSGEGYYTNLLKTITLPLIIQFFLQVAMYAVIFALLGSSLASIDPADLEAAAATGDISFVPALEQNLGLINGINALVSLAGLGIFVWVTNRIGNNYQFGWFKGCMAQFMPIIFLIIFGCVCGFILPLFGGN